jgi:hypothetical protein
MELEFYDYATPEGAAEMVSHPDWHWTFGQVSRAREALAGLAEFEHVMAAGRAGCGADRPGADPRAAALRAPTGTGCDVSARACAAHRQPAVDADQIQQWSPGVHPQPHPGGRFHHTNSGSPRQKCAGPGSHRQVPPSRVSIKNDQR